MQTLDCRRQKCPQPVVETRKLLLAADGAPLQVLVGDETARENIARLARSQGYQVDASPTEGGFALQLTPGAHPEKTAVETASAGTTVIFIGAETMGAGDDDLGRVLLKNFVITLLELDAAPDTVLFANSGVKLVCRDSEVVEALEQLACQGTDIAACGLCLDYFHLKDQVAVGRVTNMLDIATILTRAGRVVRP